MQFIHGSKNAISDAFNKDNGVEKVCYFIYAMIFPFLVLFMIITYMLFIFYWSLFTLNMKLYYARHFVSYWKGVEES
jgi:hypothetical protein